MRKILYLICLPCVFVWASCKKQLPDYGATSTVKMSNGWWVNYYNNGVLDNVDKPYFLNTYNLSSNTDSLWVDDEQYLGIKSKTKVDYANLTFSTSGALNEVQGDSVIITKGKIIPKGGHSRAGNITDSIYLQVTFSDDPGHAVWTITGTARTGLIEDDY